MPLYTFTREREVDEEEARGMIIEALKVKDERTAGLIAFLYLYGCRVGEAVGVPPYDDYPGVTALSFELTHDQLIAKIPIEKKRLYTLLCGECKSGRHTVHGMKKHYAEKHPSVTVPSDFERRKLSSVYKENFSKLPVSRDAPFVESVLLPYIYKQPDPTKRLFPISRRWAWETIKSYNQNISPHIFRHGRITSNIIHHGLAYAKAYARHSNANTTMSYAHESELLAKEGGVST